VLAVEAPGRRRPAMNSLVDETSVTYDDKSKVFGLNGHRVNDDDTAFSLEVDGRYQVAFKRVNISQAKEITDRSVPNEQTETLPGPLSVDTGSRRSAAGADRPISGSTHRRTAYPGAPRSMTGRGWPDIDDLPPSYFMGLRRLSHLFASRGGRLIPASWPRRADSDQARAGQDPTERQATTTPTLSTAGHTVNRSDASPLSTTSTSSTTVPTTVATTTAATTTTITTTEASTTTDKQLQQENQAAAVHDTRQHVGSSNNNQVFLLDIGAPEIGECLTALIHVFIISRRHC